MPTAEIWECNKCGVWTDIAEELEGDDCTDAPIVEEWNAYQRDIKKGVYDPHPPVNYVAYEKVCNELNTLRETLTRAQLECTRLLVENRSLQGLLYKAGRDLADLYQRESYTYKLIQSVIGNLEEGVKEQVKGEKDDEPRIFG